MVKMKKCWLLLLVLIACAPVQQPVIPEPEPIFEEPEILEQEPAPIKPLPVVTGNINDYIINGAIHPYSLISTGADIDSFGIIPVERYDAMYLDGGINVLVHVFKFTTKPELDVVLNSEFYQIIDEGTYYRRGETIALYLNQDNHRTAIWASGTVLIYIETFIPDFVEQEILDAYLNKYPSDMRTTQCFDNDGKDHYLKGNTNRVKIGTATVEWTDVCLKDFAPYKNKQYTSRKGLSVEDGLLEGRCGPDRRIPGYIDEYACAKTCEDGACT
jgi:hypothetical protein